MPFLIEKLKNKNSNSLLPKKIQWRYVFSTFLIEKKMMELYWNLRHCNLLLLYIEESFLDSRKQVATLKNNS